MRVKHSHSGEERDLALVEYDTQRERVLLAWPLGVNLEFDAFTLRGIGKAKHWTIDKKHREEISLGLQRRKDQVKRAGRPDWSNG